METFVDRSPQKLLSIIYQTPLGIIEMDRQGTIRQVNARGLQLLMPFFRQAGLPGTNLLHLLERHAPQLRRAIERAAPAPTPVCTRARLVLGLQRDHVQEDWYFWITINQESDGTLTVFFDDFTELYQQEQALHQAVLERAVQQGKQEVASDILNDVGRAVAAFGSYLARIRRELEEADAEHVQNLARFFEKCRADLARVLGETKSRAIVRLLKGLLVGGENRGQETSRALGEQLRIIARIQEIFSIQRPDVPEPEGPERPGVDIGTILNDCVVRQLAAFRKGGIQVTLSVQTDHTRFPGDRAQLMEVFLTLLRNSQEALERQPGKGKRIRIDLSGNDQYLTVCLADNGAGFDAPDARTLFPQEVTSRQEGPGPDLAHCRRIIESHGGRLDLTSPGRGQGAAALVTFSLSPIRPLL